MNTTMAKADTKRMLIIGALVSDALIIAPCSNRTITIRAANTSPRSNHLLMGTHLNE